jgi:NAD(P)-dependent dehydrogenase (short-subunit alcohol dehydrogenase family)
MGRLDGKVALITGGSRGIGAAIARGMAAEGATVAITYISRPDAAEAVAGETGGSAWQCDAKDLDAVLQLVDDVVARHGRLDIAVSNAGVWRGGWIEKLRYEDWNTVIETSLGGAFNLARAVTPVMKDQKAGCFITIGSVVGVSGFPGDVPYASAKAGMAGLVKALAKEVGRHNVTANVVAPGPIRTDLTAEVPDASWEKMLARTLLPRECSTEDVAETCVFLASGGRFITGQVIVVDGGMTL